MNNIVILTAVEREYEKILEMLIKIKDPTVKIEEEIDEGYCYESVIVVIDGIKYRIIISTTEQGNSEAATHTTHAILKYNPILIIFSGTCGAIKDVNIGDIVIATSVYDFTRGKEKERFVSKPISRDISANMRSISKMLMRKVNRGEILKEQFSDNGAKIFQGSIASSQIIIANEKSNARKVLNSNYADVIAVEMEGYGFYNSVYEKKFENAILLRAVTDNAKDKTDKKDEDIQPKVMERMSYFIWEVIKDVVKKK